MRRAHVLQPRIPRAFLVLPALIWPWMSLPADEIAWRGDLSAAREEAKATGKLIWVQFTGPWCGSCLQMERDTFSDDRVKSIVNANYLAVKLRSDVHEALATQHGLDRLPATLLFGPDGSVIDSVQGYAEPHWFANFLSENASKVSRTKSLGRTNPVAPKIPAALARQRFEIDGYCPVSLVDDHRLLIGSSNSSHSLDGKVYRFASKEMEARFRKNPRRYIPMNGGDCPVSLVNRGESKPGFARFGIVYGGHLLLFATNEDRLQFVKNPGRYARVGHFDRLLCSVCWATDRLSPKE